MKNDKVLCFFIVSAVIITSLNSLQVQSSFAEEKLNEENIDATEGGEGILPGLIKVDAEEPFEVASETVLKSDGSNDSSESNNLFIKLIHMGSVNSGAIDSNGNLWVWGSTSIFSNGEAPHVQMNTIKDFSLGDYHSGAIDIYGNLWMWGNNDCGGLGNGTHSDDVYEYNDTPQMVMSKIKAVSLGYGHSGAVDTEGDLWMWGNNYYGQIGDGTTNSVYSPKKIMSGVAAISLSYYSTAAVDNNGDLWIWGHNDKGQIGDGTKTDAHEPKKIMSNIKSVSIGGNHSAALDNDGNLWMWGDNSFGRIGDGTTDNVYTPKKIMGNIKSVSIGGCHSAALDNDGNLWMWGLDSGNSTEIHTPEKIMSNVKSVSLGGSHSAALDNDGNLWMWGSNYCKQIDETGIDVYAPEIVKVTSEIPDSSDDTETAELFFGSNNIPFKFQWSPRKLVKSSETIDVDLSQICLILCNKTYNPDNPGKARDAIDKALLTLRLVDDDEIKLSENLEETSNRWHVNYTNDISPAYTFALKKYSVDGKVYNIISVIVRGTQERKDIVRDIMDGGFLLAADNVYNDLEKFLEKQDIKITDNNNRFLITGHSLGGAVANLLQYYIIQNRMTSGGEEEEIPLNDGMTCYTYESPCTLWAFDRRSSQFGRSINFIKPGDIIPNLSNNYSYYLENVKTLAYSNRAIGIMAQILSVYKPKYYSSMRFGQDVTLGDTTTNVLKRFKEYSGKDYSNSDLFDQYHQGEILMALIQERIVDGSFNKTNRTISHMYKVLSTYCPVDIEITDYSSGENIVSIFDNNITAR